MSKKEIVQASYRTESETLADLDKYAEKMGLSRNQLMNNLVNIGLDDLRNLDRLGMIRLGVGIRTMMEKLREPEQKILFE